MPYSAKACVIIQNTNPRLSKFNLDIFTISNGFVTDHPSGPDSGKVKYHHRLNIHEVNLKEIPKMKTKVYGKKVWEKYLKLWERFLKDEASNPGDGTFTLLRNMLGNGHLLLGRSYCQTAVDCLTFIDKRDPYMDPAEKEFRTSLLQVFKAAAIEDGCVLI